MKPTTQMSQRVMNCCKSVVQITSNGVYHKDFKIKGYCSYDIKGLDLKTTYKQIYQLLL